MSMSTRKDPVSMKLRTANMKPNEVQNRTKELEEESRKMEERLRELKLAMNKEKELREQRGGGYWKSGKEGNLGNHAKEVLSKPPSKPRSGGSSGRARKVKVLKDEPVVKERTKEPPKPGTMSFLAERGASNKGPVGLRSKGPICGQCEIRTAVVTCQECSELYCSGCFTAFHLKGALAKHHSVPVTKTSPSQKKVETTPRANAPSRIVWEERELTPPVPINSSTDLTVTEESEKEISFPGPSLLDGEYDEKEAAQSFQQALSEWRKENTDPAPPKQTSSRTIKPTQLGTRKPKIQAVSPVHTPRVAVDEGTSTSSGSTQPATDFIPEFHNSELSYADRLMLKKNRRSEIPALSNKTSVTSSPQGFNDSTLQSDSDGTRLSEEVVSFASLLSTVQQGEGHTTESLSLKSQIVDIQEIQDDMEDSGVYDNSTNYVVSEGQLVEEENGDMGCFITPRPAPSAADTTCHNASRHSKMTSASVSTVQIVDVTDVPYLSHSPPSVQKSSPPHHSYSPTSGQKPTNTEPASTYMYKPSLSLASGDGQDPRLPSAIRDGQVSSNSRVRTPPTARSESKVSRPASGLARPVSRQNTMSRPMRPKSVAQKAAEHYGPTVLTREPSQALKDIANRYGSATELESVPYGGNRHPDLLGEFFTVGVRKVQEEKVITPSKDKPKPGQPIKKYQLSNKVYALSGKTWRPSSSMADEVEDSLIQPAYLEDPEQGQPFTTEFADHPAATPPLQMTIRYSWSASNSRSQTGVEILTEPIPAGQEEEDRLSPSGGMSQQYSVTQPQTHPLTPTAPSRVSGSVTPQVTHSRNRKSSARSSSRTGLEMSASQSQIKSDGRGQSQRNKRNRELSSRGMTPRSAKRTCVTPIVVDGDDMTQYDNILPADCTNDELDTINDLELELASQTGRLTADGRLSRLVDDDDLYQAEDYNIPLNLNESALFREAVTTPTTHRDIDKLRESMMDDFEENELLIMQDEAMRVSLL